VAKQTDKRTPDQGVLDEIDRRLLAIGRNRVQLDAAEALLNDELQAVRERHAAEITHLAGKVSLGVEALEGYVRQHKAEAFTGKLKTLRLMFGSVAFRTRKGSVALRKGFALDDVIAELKRSLLGYFVRTREELNKDRIAAALADGEVSDEMLRTMGITIARAGESFACDLNLERVSDELRKAG